MKINGKNIYRNFDLFQEILETPGNIAVVSGWGIITEDSSQKKVTT